MGFGSGVEILFHLDVPDSLVHASKETPVFHLVGSHIPWCLASLGVLPMLRGTSFAVSPMSFAVSYHR